MVSPGKMRPAYNDREEEKDDTKSKFTMKQLDIILDGLNNDTSNLKNYMDTSTSNKNAYKRSHNLNNMLAKGVHNRPDTGITNLINLVNDVINDV